MPTWLSTICEFARTYQTLIAGVVGFSGVIVTLLVNAYLARSQERRRDARDANALRRALIEELKLQRGALERAVESLDRSFKAQDQTHGGGVLPLERFSDIFDRSIDKLGLLSRSEVAAVLQAYLPLRGLTPKLRLIEILTKREPLADWLTLNKSEFPTAGEMHKSYIPAIDAAISALEAPRP